MITSYAVFGPGTLQSYDAETGVVDWTTTFSQGIAFETAPTAANGFVYLVGGSVGTILFALDEPSGSIVWQQSGLSGTGSTPAVTFAGRLHVARGVYYRRIRADDGRNLVCRQRLMHRRRWLHRSGRQQCVLFARRRHLWVK